MKTAKEMREASEASQIRLARLEYERVLRAVTHEIEKAADNGDFGIFLMIPENVGELIKKELENNGYVVTLGKGTQSSISW